MDTPDWPQAEFQAHRAHLHAVAYRMLGSLSEADDAVQETWLRLAGADTGEVRNMRAWLTTVTARVCLDMLRARTARREDPERLARLGLTGWAGPAPPRRPAPPPGPGPAGPASPRSAPRGT